MISFTVHSVDDRNEILRCDQITAAYVNEGTEAARFVTENL